MKCRKEKAYAAHIDEAKNIHALEAHLAKVAKRAAGYAAAFNADQWAELAGRWHDLGKYSATFQKMIYEANGMEAHIEPEIAGPRATCKSLKQSDEQSTSSRIWRYIF